MSKHVGVLSGLIYLIRITEIRGSHGAHTGELVDRDTNEVVFECDFPSYSDAYCALMEMDANSFDTEGDSPV